jgi:general secretion pathway protein B
MSYILEALRKSEQDRQMAAGQAASVLYPVAVERPAGARLNQLLAGVAALLAAAAAAGWLWWRPAPPAAGLPAAVAIPAVPSPPSARPAPKVAEPSSVALRLAPALETRQPVATAPQSPAAVSVARKVTAEAPDKSVAEAPSQGAGDLPPALQKELPPLSVSGYISDGQGGRLAMINDKLVREGDEIAPGLRLEKVLGESAVFSFRGYRFRR